MIAATSAAEIADMADFRIGQKWEEDIGLIAYKSMARLSLRMDREFSSVGRGNILDRLAAGCAESRRSGGASGHPADLWRWV